MIREIEIFFTGSTPGAAASVVDIIEGWDGSIYAETNCIELAGENMKVEFVAGVFYVDGNVVNGGLNANEIQLLKRRGR